MTDITKFKNVSLSLKTYTDVGTLPLSLSKAIEYLVEKEIKKVTTKGKSNGKGSKG